MFNDTLVEWAQAYTISTVQEATFADIVKASLEYFDRSAIESSFGLMMARHRHICTNYDNAMSDITFWYKQGTISSFNIKEEARGILQEKAQILFCEWWMHELLLYGRQITHRAFESLFNEIASGDEPSAICGLKEWPKEYWLLVDGAYFTWDEAARYTAFPQRRLRQSMHFLYEGIASFPLYKVVQDWRLYDPIEQEIIKPKALLVA